MIKNVFYMILLTILLLISTFLIIYNQIINKNYLIKILDNNYYNINFKEIEEKMNNVTPNEYFKNTYNSYLNLNNLKKDTLNIINNKKNNFNEYLKTKYLDNDEDTKKLISSLTTIYNENLFNIRIYNYIHDKISINLNTKIVLVITLFITIISFIFILFDKNISAFGSFIITGILLILFKLYINNFLDNINIYNKSMTYFIKNFGYNITNEVFNIGLVLLIIGLILFTIHCFYKKD